MFKVRLIEKPDPITAAASLYMSKGNVDKAHEIIDAGEVSNEVLGLLHKWGFEKHHTQLLKSVSWSYMVEGLGRGSFDDLRTHEGYSIFLSKSTRYCDDFEVGPWFLENMPVEELEKDKRTIQEVKESDLDHDIKGRRLPLTVDTPFTVKTNLAHFIHMIGQRGPAGHAHEELQILTMELVKELFEQDDMYSKWTAFICWKVMRKMILDKHPLLIEGDTDVDYFIHEVMSWWEQYVYSEIIFDNML